MSQPARPRSVIVSGARTPMGRLLGSLKDFSAADLGGVAIRAALERAGISGDQVDYVIMGQVIQAGAGQNPARPAAVAGARSLVAPLERAPSYPDGQSDPRGSRGLPC